MSQIIVSIFECTDHLNDCLIGQIFELAANATDLTDDHHVQTLTWTSCHK